MNATLDTLFNFHHAALDVRASRQQLLASNIANADTPGYAARDLDFRKALSDALSGENKAVTLARTAPAHVAIAPAGAAVAAERQALYRTTLQPSLDGNSVALDVERARFTENAIHMEANLTFINHQIKAMLAAIQG